MIRSHGWQRPFHPLQIVGIAVYIFLVVSFYVFLGLFLGNPVLEISVVTVFTFAAFSVMLLFIRCTALDPSDKISYRKKRRRKSNGLLKLKFGFILTQIVVRFFRRVERKIFRTFIRRKYLAPWKSAAQIEPFLPFPFVLKDDAVSPDTREDISFCSLCDFEVKKKSKHCRACNRCVEGFDHHCRWLNNCIGKKNYTTFILLMISLLLMLVVEGGTAIAIFVRCFSDKSGIEKELRKKLYVEFPREALATISVVLVLMIAYCSAAMAQLLFFHVVLIRKGMRTYDYILAMKEENQSMELDPFDDSDLSSEGSIDFDSPEKPNFVSNFLCRGHSRRNENPTRLSIKIDKDSEPPNSTKKQGFRASIDPWKLIKMSREKALAAAEKAKERLMREKPMMQYNSLKPLPLETKSGPLLKQDKPGLGVTPLISKGRLLQSPRRRFSSSPTVVPSPKQKYRNNFDLKLTEVSRELEAYISKQVLCSVLKEKGNEGSPKRAVA